MGKQKRRGVFLILGVLIFSCGKGEKECKTNDDCPSGQVCIAGSCKTPQKCLKDSDCDSGYVCVNNICVPKEGGECTTDSDCPQNYVCEDGTCVAKDMTPPDTTITSYPQTITNSTSATFEFTCNEGDCTFECQLDNINWSSCTSPKTYTGLSEGEHTFSVRAIDPAGNVDVSPAIWTWTIDLKPPLTELTSYPSSLTNSALSTFEFNCDEENCSFECSLNGSGYSSCSSPATYQLSDGKHTFSVRAIDPAGNVDETPENYSWTIHTVPPETYIISSSPAGITTSTTAEFEFDCGDDYLPCTYECELDSGGWESCPPFLYYSNLSEGEHTLKVRAIDAAGNVDPSPEVFSWVILGDICSSIGDALRILNPIPREGYPIYAGGNYLTLPIEYNFKSQSSNVDIVVNVTDENWNILTSETKSISPGCGEEMFSVYADIPNGTKMVYVKAFFALPATTIADYLNYAVIPISDYVSIASTKPTDGSLITPGNVTLLSRVDYNFTSEQRLNYSVYDEHGNILDTQYVDNLQGSGSLNFTSQFSLGCVEMVYIKVQAEPSGLLDIVAYSIKSSTLMVSPSSLVFYTPLNGDSPPQNISITKCSASEISWNISDNANWLSEVPASGTTPASVTVDVNPAGIPLGTYSAVITISSAQASNSPVTLPVTLNVINMQIQWQEPLPSSPMASGIPYYVSYSITGSTSGSGRIQYGTDPDPRINYSSFTEWLSGGNGTYTHSIIMSTPITQTYYFVVNWYEDSISSSVYSQIFQRQVNPPPDDCILFNGDMESGDNGYTKSGYFHLVESGGTCGNTAHSGIWAWWYGMDGLCDYDHYGANSGYLITPESSPSCSGINTATISFWSWEETECTTSSCSKDIRKVEVSINNGAWIEKWRSNNSVRNSWYQVVIPLTGINQGSTIKLRFSFDTIDGENNHYRGWYIDDIMISQP